MKNIQSDFTTPEDPGAEILADAAALIEKEFAAQAETAPGDKVADLIEKGVIGKPQRLSDDEEWTYNDLIKCQVAPEDPEEKASDEARILELGGDPKLCRTRFDRRDVIRELETADLAEAVWTAPTTPEMAIHIKERDAKEREEDNRNDNAELYRTAAAIVAENQASKREIEEVPELLRRFPVRTCGELLECFPDPPAPIIEGIIGEGEKMILGGASKAGKTYCVLNLADAVDTGGKWLGHQCRKGGVLFLNFEVGESRMAERVRRLRESGLAMTGVEFLNLRGAEFTWESLKGTLEYLARRNGYVLIIIDPIYKLLGETPENDNTAVALMLAQIERIAVETKAAVVFAHHFSKGNKAEVSSMDRLSGAGAFARDPDAIITLTEHEISNCFTVEATVRNYATPAPVVVEYINPRYTVRDELDSARLKQVKRGGGHNKKGDAETATETLRRKGGKLTRKELAKTLSADRKVTERSARDWIKDAENDGMIVEMQGFLTLPDPQQADPWEGGEEEASIGWKEGKA